jgi:hypothetical protein
VDLRQYAPPIINQGPVPSDLAWAVAYYQRGWYARRDGYYPAGNAEGRDGFSPLYLFNLENQGVDGGSTFPDVYHFLWSHGVDRRADFPGGDFNFEYAPTAADQLRAQHYPISSYQIYDLPTGTPEVGETVRALLAAGDPVVLGIKAYEDFLALNRDNYVYHYEADGTDPDFVGGHGLTAFAYDQEGVWAANTFGTEWGLDGWVKFTWESLNAVTSSVATLAPLRYGPFTVTASAPKGSPGETLVLSGSGFERGAHVSVYGDSMDERPLARGRAGTGGKLRVKVQVPQLPFGLHRLLIVDENGRAVVVPLHVVPAITVRQVGLGSLVKVTGRGFQPDIPAGLAWNDLSGPRITTVTPDASGQFTYQFRVPRSTPAGSKIVAFLDHPWSWPGTPYSPAPYLFEYPYPGVAQARIPNRLPGLVPFVTGQSPTAQ